MDKDKRREELIIQLYEWKEDGKDVLRYLSQSEMVADLILRREQSLIHDHEILVNTILKEKNRMIQELYKKIKDISESSGFWGRTCARQSDKIKKLEQKISEAVKCLKEYKEIDCLDVYEAEKKAINKALDRLER